jgi:hypothetical protein
MALGSYPRKDTAMFRNLNPRVLNPGARPIGTGSIRKNITILPETIKKAKEIGGGNMSAGIDKSVNAAIAISSFKEALKKEPTEHLKSINFAIASFPKMPHQILGGNRIDQAAIDADLCRWLIQRELDSRKGGELPYSLPELYLALSIPKEFLR